MEHSSLKKGIGVINRHAGAGIQWGAWAGVGMAARQEAVLARIVRSGMGVIYPAAGLHALEQIITLSSAGQLPGQVLILHVDSSKHSTLELLLV